MEKEKNYEKGKSYEVAWSRIQSAQEGKFYFEVVTLCESIISDRLLSYVNGVEPGAPKNITISFRKLIEAWRRLGAEELQLEGDEDLGDAVDKWREERNAIVHGLVKSMPGTPTLPVGPFIMRAEAASAKGVELAGKVSAWHKKVYRKVQK